MEWNVRCAWLLANVSHIHMPAFIPSFLPWFHDCMYDSVYVYAWARPWYCVRDANTRALGKSRVVFPMPLTPPYIHLAFRFSLFALRLSPFSFRLSLFTNTTRLFLFLFVAQRWTIVVARPVTCRMYDYKCGMSISYIQYLIRTIRAYLGCFWFLYWIMVVIDAELYITFKCWINIFFLYCM